MGRLIPTGMRRPITATGSSETGLSLAGAEACQTRAGANPLCQLSLQYGNVSVRVLRVPALTSAVPAGESAG